MVITQAPVPKHAGPFQPAKVEPGAANGVRVTTVPSTNELLQVAPQEMPDGLEVTLPVPDRVTVSWNDEGLNASSRFLTSHCGIVREPESNVCWFTQLPGNLSDKASWKAL
jgi:hypothetical protein